MGVVAVVVAAFPCGAACEDDREWALGEEAAEQGGDACPTLGGGGVEVAVDAELDEVGALFFGESGIGEGDVDGVRLGRVSPGLDEDRNTDEGRHEQSVPVEVARRYR